LEPLALEAPDDVAHLMSRACHNFQLMHKRR
jgi:hypothetical protein